MSYATISHKPVLRAESWLRHTIRLVLYRNINLAIHLITENKRSPIWQLCRHWWHRKLSLRQLTVPPMTTKLSNWRSFVLNEGWILSILHNITHVWQLLQKYKKSLDILVRIFQDKFSKFDTLSPSNGDELIHYGPVKSYGVIEWGHLWIRQRLVTCAMLDKTLNKTNGGLLAIWPLKILQLDLKQTANSSVEINALGYFVCKMPAAMGDGVDSW